MSLVRFRSDGRRIAARRRHHGGSRSARGRYRLYTARGTSLLRRRCRRGSRRSIRSSRSSMPRNRRPSVAATRSSARANEAASGYAMNPHFDTREARDPRQRELDLIGHLPGLIAKALKAPGWRKHLGDIDAAAIATRADLARLPVLRKSDLPALQKATPPFGGLIDPVERFGRLFTSPGPIYEAGGTAGRRLARGSRTACGRIPRVRSGAEHIFVSPDARRLHPRWWGACARLRRDSRGSRQYRTAARTDTTLAPDGVHRNAGFPEDPARRGCGIAGWSRRSDGPPCPELHSRLRCRPRSVSAESMRTSSMQRLMSASLPTRPRRGPAWSSTKTFWSRSCDPAPAIRCRTGKWAKWSSRRRIRTTPGSGWRLGTCQP